MEGGGGRAVMLGYKLRVHSMHALVKRGPGVVLGKFFEYLELGEKQSKILNIK